MFGDIRLWISIPAFLPLKIRLSNYRWISKILVGNAGAKSVKFSWFLIFTVSAKDRPAATPINTAAMMVMSATIRMMIDRFRGRTMLNAMADEPTEGPSFCQA